MTFNKKEYGSILRVNLGTDISTGTDVKVILEPWRGEKQEKTTNIAVGTSLKGFLNIPKSNGEASEDTVSSKFNPNMDFGVYYYGPSAFAGLSITSLFGTKITNEVTIESDAYIQREYHLHGGYKFLLSRNNAIVLEPSLLVSLNDSTFSEIVVDK